MYRHPASRGVPQHPISVNQMHHMYLLITLTVAFDSFFLKGGPHDHAVDTGKTSKHNQQTEPDHAI